MSVELATAYVNLVPSARGFGSAVAAEAGSAGGTGGTAFTGAFSKMALAGAAAAGVAIGAAIYTGVTGAMEQQAGAGRLQGQLGLTDAQAAEAGRIAGSVYANNFGGSVAEAQEAVGAVMSTLGENLGVGGLEKATEQALTFADLFEVDVTTAANTAGTAISSGLAGDATQAFDLMTAASQRMPAEMRAELMPAIDEYGGFLADLGIKGPDAFGLLAEASKDGQYGIDKTGDALKELTIRATDMSETSKAAYESAGLNAEDMAAKIAGGGDGARVAFDQIVDGLKGIEDPVERANASIGLFGTPLEDLGVSGIPDFLDSLDTMGAGLGDVAGVTDKAAEDSNKGLGSWVEEMKRKGQQGLTNFFTGIGEAYSEGGMDGVMDHLGGMWDEAWPKIQEKMGLLWEKVRVWLIDVGLPALGNGIKDGASALWQWLQEAYPPFAAKMGEFWGKIANWIAEVGLPALGEWLKKLGPALWQWIQDAWPSFAQKMAEFWAMVGVWLTTVAVPWLLEKGAELWAALGEWLWTEAIPAILRGLGSLMESIRAWITDTAIPWLREKAGEWFAVIRQKAMEWGLLALAWLMELPGKISEWITSTAIPWLKEKAGEWFQSLKDKAEEKGKEAIDWMKELPEKMRRALGDLGKTLLQAGRNLIQGLINGIMEKVPFLKDTLGVITDQVPDWKGPPVKDRKLLFPAGEMIMGGLSAGIISKKPALAHDLAGVTRMIAVGARPTVSMGRTWSAVGADSVAGSSNQQIEVPVILDGREIARASYRHTASMVNSARKAST